MDPGLLEVAHETVDDAVVVRVAGELDMMTAPVLHEHLEQVYGQTRAPQVVVADLTGLRFLGSAGIAELLEAHERCQDQQTPLWVVAAEPNTVRPLRLTGVDQILHVVGSLASVPRSA